MTQKCEKKKQRREKKTNIIETGKTNKVKRERKRRR